LDECATHQAGRGGEEQPETHETYRDGAIASEGVNG
jgi:hypothetical protein